MRNEAAQLLACVSGSMLEREPATEVSKSGFMRTNRTQNSHWSEINRLAL